MYMFAYGRSLSGILVYFFVLQDSTASTPLSTNEQGLSSFQVSAPCEVLVCAYECAECATVCSGGCGLLRRTTQFPGKPGGEDLVLLGLHVCVGGACCMGSGIIRSGHSVTFSCHVAVLLN